jgi:glycosyltransferase involved in cell wall biosynthesis
MKKSAFDYSCQDFSSPALRERILLAAGKGRDIQERLDRLGKILAERIPYITDEFSALRYAGQVMDSLSLAGKYCRPPRTAHPLIRAAVNRLNRDWPGSDFKRLLRKQSPDILELYFLLLRLRSAPGAVSMGDLLARAGESPYTDLLIKENLWIRLDAQVDSAAEWRQLVRAGQGPARGAPQELLLLELIAEGNLRVLAAADYEILAARFPENPRVLCALIRGAGIHAGGAIPDLVRSRLARWSDLPEEVRLHLLAALLSRANRERRTLLKQLPRRGPELSSFRLIREFAAAASKVLAAGKTQSPGGRKGGLRLVQTVMNANPQQGGQARAGGLHTFLSGLGRSLCACRGIEQVVTAEIIPWSRMHPSLSLKEASTDPHHVRLRVPVPFLRSGDPADLARAESDIGYFLGAVLNLQGVRPCLFHARFTDNCSRAAFLLADRLGAQKVFTLTADPHRGACDRRGRLRTMGPERALGFLHRVAVADWINRQADGLLGIAHGNANAQLLSYFPALCMDPSLRAKPVQLIPEGIDLSLPARETGGALDLLRRHTATYRLAPERRGRPLIFNVGRLLPVKGQHLLVRAWSESSLGRLYNLVLVGGDLENPDRVEAKMIGAIRRCLGLHPELEGGFSHLSSLANQKVRLLERALAEERWGGIPPVYVCSSLKEEFGISILEALSAGFLVFAPREGGVASYLEHGKNGFLMDTHRAGSIRAALEAVLLSPAYPAAELAAIAEAGRRLVREHFSIRALAARFEEFYLHICAREAPR